MKQPFTFIDLFAGIGGMRMAFEKAGGKCVFSSEIDKFARMTYEHNYNDIPSGDITKIESKDIPDHDILVGGFPCQPFSTAGARKGLQDTRGTLFYEMERIIRDRQPSAFLLENVMGLLNIDNGNTFKTIIKALTALDYQVQYEVLNANKHVPQKRERVFIVGFKDKTWFEFPEKPRGISPILRDILADEVDGQYTLSKGELGRVKNLALILQKRPDYGGGFGWKPFTPNRQLGTLLSSERSVPIIEQENKNLRFITPNECVRLMGFDQIKPGFSFPNGMSDTPKYNQLGNSVVPPLIYDIAKEMIKSL